MSPEAAFKVCSTCKKPIAFGSTYYVCSVSTCNRARSGFVFCSVDCWEAHVPMMRHRDAGAVEEKAPSREQWAAEQAAEKKAAEGSAAPKAAPSPESSTGPAVRRRIAVASPERGPAPPREVLVVASKLKGYIRQRYGMNTSDAVLEVLSDALRRLADEAVLRARAEGRKTVLDRDFEGE